MRAVGHPDMAPLIRRDGTAAEILVRPGDGERTTPLALAIVADEELIAELRLIELAKVGRLLLQLLGVEAPALVLQRVADPGDPERAVGFVAGCGEVVL